ncbi:MAG: tryptophan-rich sensory protein [Clostridia bacterium]|nr:tryptophan-rich sensory protein [Clostridia bacterium]
MKINWKLLIICIAIPLAVGGISALVTHEAMESFSSLNQPPLSPPPSLFPVVWSILFTLMGIASYLVCTSGAQREEIRGALWLYGIQLLINFLWTIIFFNFAMYTFAFLWILMLLAFVIANTVSFYKIRKSAGLLLLPYVAWIIFAGYLNFMISVLN